MPLCHLLLVQGFYRTEKNNLCVKKDLIKCINEGKITTKIGKTILHNAINWFSISEILEKKSKKRISDEKLLEKFSYEVIEENPKIVKDCSENPKAIEALIGRIMQKTKG